MTKAQVILEGHLHFIYSGTPLQRYAKGAVELDRYIEVSLHRDSRYNDIAVK